VGLIELDGDAAWFQPDASGEVLKLLGQNLKGGFDQEARLVKALLVELGEDGGDFAAALELVNTILAGGEMAEVGDEGIAVGEGAGAEVVGDAGGHDLLGAAGADAVKPAKNYRDSCKNRQFHRNSCEN